MTKTWAALIEAVKRHSILVHGPNPSGWFLIMSNMIVSSVYPSKLFNSSTAWFIAYAKLSLSDPSIRPRATGSSSFVFYSLYLIFSRPSLMARSASDSLSSYTSSCWPRIPSKPGGGFLRLNAVSICSAVNLTFLGIADCLVQDSGSSKPSKTAEMRSTAADETCGLNSVSSSYRKSGLHAYKVSFSSPAAAVSSSKNARFTSRAAILS